MGGIQKGENHMNKKCVECGGELIEGKLAGNYAVCFYPSGEEKKMNGKRSKTICLCCKACGLIQEIRAVEPHKLV